MAENINTQKSARLEEMMKQRFTPNGRQERIARALAALHQKEPIKLSADEWKWVAEDAEIEDRF